MKKYRIILLCCLLVIGILVQSSVSVLAYGFSKFGGGDNLWLVSILASCRDGAILASARSKEPVPIPVTSTLNGGGALLPGGTTIAPIAQPESIFVRIEPGSDRIAEFPFYNVERVYYTSPIDDATYDYLSATDFTFDLEDDAVRLFNDVPVNNCSVADSYSNFDFFGQIDGFYGNGLVFDVVDGDVDDAGNIYLLEASIARVQKFDPAGNFITQWGSVGEGNGQFQNAEQIAVDPDGYVYVIDNEAGAQRVQKFDTNGNYLFDLSPPSTYSFVYGITTDSNGNVYTADNNNGLIRFDSSGSFTGTIAPAGAAQGQIDFFDGMDYGPDNFIYVIEDSEDLVQRYPVAGGAYSEWATGPGVFGNIAVADDGTVYLTNEGLEEIYAYTSAGAPATPPNYGGPALSVFTEVRSVFVDGTRFFVPDQRTGAPPRVVIYDTATMTYSQFADVVTTPGLFNEPSDVATDLENNVYVVDQSNFRIQKLDPEGNPLLIFGSAGGLDGQFDTPDGIAVADDGSIYVTDSTLNRVQKFDDLGVYVTQWGTPGGTPGTSNGHFDSPTGIDVDSDGNVFVVDEGNDRIQKFDMNGNYVTQWGTAGAGNGQFSTPTDVAVNSMGNVYVADSGNDRVQVFDNAGTYIETIGTAGNESGEFGEPFSVDIGPADYVFVYDYRANVLQTRVQVFDDNHDFYTEFGRALSDSGTSAQPDDLTGQFNIAVDQTGRVYIADTPFNRIMYYEQLDAPKSNPEQYVVEANSSLLVVAPGILSNDRSDEFAEAYSPQIVQNATGGDLFLSPSGGLIYEPGENYTGQDFFTYRLLDDTSQSYAVKVQLNVTNPVPVTEPDIYFTENGVSLTVEAAEGVLANDVDPNGDTMTAVLATDAEHGVLALNPDGSFSYAPDSGFGGQDSFTYTASDGTGSSEPTTVNLNVGYPLTPAPTTLVAMGDFDTPPVLPLLTWGHQTSAGQKKAPGDWYNVEIRLGTDLVIYSGWFPVNRVCAGVNCSLQTDKSMLPVGLQNGDHVFRVRSWADGVFSEWSAASGFNVNVPTPAFPMTFTVKPEEPRPTVVVDNDPNATWYEIWIGSTGDTDPFSHLAWYEKTGCEDALTCTIYLDAHPTNGTYQVYISGWGPAGFAVDGTNNRWSGPVDWSLSFPNAAAIGSMTPTNVNSGRPTFLWDASPGASWYNLYVGPPDFSETLAFEWYSAVELGCVDPNESCTAIPPLILEDGSSYVWYVLAWGPGGFSETVDAGYVEGPQFTVDAALAGTPTPIAPTTTQNGSQPTFSWEAVPDASWYRLLLEQLLAGDDAITSDVWYPAEALGCSDDGICETQIDNVYLGDGTYIWLVQAYTPAGLGDVSDAATFKVLRQ